MPWQDQLAAATPGQRYQAAVALYRAAPPLDDALIEALISALGDDHPGVRTYAHKTLLHAPQQTIPAILARLDGLTHALQLVGCAAVLAQGDGPAVRQALHRLYQDKRAAVREAALQAISRQDDPQYIPVLVEALSDGAASVRYHAALGLARHDLKVALPPLLAAVHDENVLVRGAALYALGHSGDPQAIAFILDSLGQAIADTNIDPAVTAVAGQPMTAEEFRRFTAGHGQADLPLLAVDALVRLGQPAVEPLRAALAREADPKLRLCVAWALYRIDPTQRPASLAALTDNRPALHGLAQRLFA